MRSFLVLVAVLVSLGIAQAQNTGTPTILQAIQALESKIDALAAAQGLPQVLQRLDALSQQLQQLSTTVDQLAAQVNTTTARKKFYLSPSQVGGAEVLDKCATGYHFASLWEILDPSHLEYDSTRGLTRDDTGSGPPSGVNGWIRTGSQASSVTAIPATDNCGAWGQFPVTPPFEKGTIIKLPGEWDSPGTISDPWIASVSLCSFPQFFWCVQD
jgi:outer membrane murein-binding lipoprotein Lpp